MRHDLAALERANQSFWHRMWASVEPEAVQEEGIAAKRFGPVLATSFERDSEEIDLNLIQGAAEPGAVEEGHLARAIEWMRWQEVEYRMPVAADRPGAELASQWLEERGYEREGTEIAFVRPAGGGELPPEEGIEVLGLDSTLESDRNRGCHKALLRRRLLDAAQAGCHTVLAEVAEGEEFAAARHNLIEAGFEPAYVSHDWMRPSLRSALS